MDVDILFLKERNIQYIQLRDIYLLIRLTDFLKDFKFNMYYILL